MSCISSWGLQALTTNSNRRPDITSPTSPAGQSTSFKTNINRAKTKRWVEAKQYNYDGDDWGDVDEYDEYGGYDEPPPQKPTGLRQRGQSINQGDNASSTGTTPTYPPQSAMQQPGGYGIPQPQTPGHVRSNSFDPEDERQGFSSGYGAPPSSMQDSRQHGPATRFSQIPGVSEPGWQPKQRQGQPPLQIQTQPPMQNRRPSNPAISASFARSGPPIENRAQSMTTQSAHPDLYGNAPMQSSGSAQPRISSQPQADTGGKFPPRKSSLSRPSRASIDEPSSEQAAIPPQERRPSNPAKALPFIRPADIYKRMAEEREKQRKSEESSRPSMDSILGRPAAEDAPPVPRKRTSSESLGRRRESLESNDDSDSHRRLKPKLDTLAERKSEYGLEGLLAADQHSVEGSQVNPNPTQSVSDIPTESPRNIPESAIPMRKESGSMPGPSDPLSASSLYSDESIRRGLPELRGSETTFGDDWLAATSQRSDSQADPSKQDSETSLHHAPSLGYRSLVHQAFDKTEDKAVSPTPASLSGSVARTNSDSTSAISPIIGRSRGIDSGLPETKHAVIAEEKESRPRPDSARTLTDATAAPLDDVKAESQPPSFMPGHRRDLSTPSPGNSPARSPDVGRRTSAEEPRVAQVSTVTPSDTEESEADEARFNGQQENSVRQPYGGKVGQGSFADRQQADFERSAPLSDSPVPRSETPSKGTVRGLADRFESSSRPSSAGSNRSPTRRPPSVLEEVPAPGSTRVESAASFRPPLPGGWNSYATTAGEQTPGLEKPLPAPRSHQRSQSPSKLGSVSTPEKLRSQDRDITSPSVEGPVHRTEETPRPQQSRPSATEDPFSAVAAAGSALAGAFAAATGIGREDEEDDAQDNASITSKESWEQDYSRNPSPERHIDAGSSIAAGPNGPQGHGTETMLLPIRHPTGEVRLQPPRLNSFAPSASDASSLAPSPPPKDTPLAAASRDDSAREEYFPSTMPLRKEEKGPFNDTKDLPPPVRPPMLPQMSTEDRSEDQESDRLRKEIMQTLSPVKDDYKRSQDRESSFDTAKPSSSQGAGDMLLPEQAATESRPKSSSMLSDYERYWTSADNDDRPISKTDQAKSDLADRPSTALEVPIATAQPTYLDYQTNKSHSRPRETIEQPRIDPPTINTRRFSWEATPEQTPKSSSTAEEAVFPAPLSVPHSRSRSVSAERELANAKDAGGISVPSVEPSSLLANDLSNERPPIPLQDSKPEDEQEMLRIAEPVDQVGRPPDLPPRNQSGGAMPEPTSTGSHPQEIEPSVELPDPVFAGNERENRSSLDKQLPRSPGIQTSQTQAKLMGFRDITALRVATDRIDAFNSTRTQFAGMDTGLSAWIESMGSAHPEHAEIIASNGSFAPGSYTPGHRVTPSRSKFGTLPRLSGITSKPFSQDHIDPAQQNLQNRNVSGGSAQPSFGPSGSGQKLSKQEMQAKGKDLLHSAGVFGGKAGGAAKGLLAKGKSRFRTSGGGDKVD